MSRDAFKLTPEKQVIRFLVLFIKLVPSQIIMAMCFRKGILFISILLTIATHMLGQAEVDSLERQLNETIHDSVKVGILLRLSTIFRITDANKSMAYATRALVFVDTLKPNKSACGIYEHVARGHLLIGQSDKSIAFSKIGLRMSKRINYDAFTSKYHLRIGHAFYQKGQIDNAIAFLDSALMYQDGIQDEATLASVYEGLSAIYFQKGDYSSSLTNALKSLEIAERNNEEENIARNSLNIGSLYMKIADNENALKHLNRSKKWAEDENDLHFLVDVYDIIGLLYSKSGPDSALIYHKKALRLGRATDQSPIKMAGIYSNIASIHISKNESILSETALLKGLELIKDEIKHPFRVNILSNLCKFYTQQNRLDDARRFCEKALKLNREIENKGELPALLDGLSELYVKNNDYKSAYRAVVEKSIVQTSLVNESKLAQIAEARLEFDFAKEQHADSLQYIQALNIQQLEIDKKQNQQRWFILGIFLLAILLGALFYAYSIKLKANEVIAKEKEEAERQKNRAEKSELKLKELDAAKTRMYTNITHEFRTPLTVISGMANQIKENPKVWLDEGIEMVERNSNRLLGLVNQMLDLNKLESGAISLNNKQDDVVNYIKYLSESLHSLFESKKVDLEFQAETANLIMDFDEIRLQQVIINLLSNAVKFTPTGGHVELQVKQLTAGADQQPMLQISIKDDGIGIAPDQLPFIFDRFYQADNASTRVGEGSGIGLALVRELIKLMNGEITAESKLGGGTAFTIQLPISNVAERHEMVPISKPEVVASIKPHFDSSEQLVPIVRHSNGNGHASGTRPTLLIIEDNPDVVTYLHACLSDQFQLLVGNDGQQGIELAFDQIPDVIITDVMMPRKDGFEVCQTLKTDVRTSHIPIIMLTAKADIESKLLGLDKGADAYLSKPFDKKELLIRLKKLLELRGKLQSHYLSVAGLNEELLEQSNLPDEEMAEHQFVKQMREIVDRHLSDDQFGVEQFSQEANLSTSQLNRKLSALVNLSANKFIRDIRLKEAKILLKDQSLTIAEIAYQIGFSDPAYFSRLFKKEVGVSPVDFRFI